MVNSQDARSISIFLTPSRVLYSMKLRHHLIWEDGVLKHGTQQIIEVRTLPSSKKLYTSFLSRQRCEVCAFFAANLTCQVMGLVCKDSVRYWMLTCFCLTFFACLLPVLVISWLQKCRAATPLLQNLCDNHGLGKEIGEKKTLCKCL